MNQENLDLDYAISDFINNFEYVNDGKIDSWRIVNDQDNYAGDCDDFAITLCYLFSNKSLFQMWKNLLLRKFEIYMCTYNQRGHVILKLNNIHNYQDLWIDNITRKLRNWESIPHQYEVKYRIPTSFIAIKLLVGKLLG